MSDQSAIEWTDATWNPVRGCVKVSPGCAHCYAETFAERFRGVKGHPYEQGFDLRLVPEKLDEPLRWKKPRRVFVNSMSDLFQDGVPDAFIDGVFWVMQQTERHTYQVLTKRAERMRDYCRGLASLTGRERGARILTSQGWSTRASEVSGDGFPWPLPNVWLGVSVENQHFADERIPLLLQTPAAVRFISAEPLLQPVELSDYLPVETIGGVEMETWPDWVIVGGESGPGARPFDLAWCRSIVKQCQSAGVAVFVKQLGARPVKACQHCPGVKTHTWPGQCRMFGRDGHGHDGMLPVHLKSSKGGDMAEWPDDLRVRQFPRPSLTMTT